MAKKKAAEGHHGGAWKVAYADFVTAMMALFMVLWISAQDKKILLSTSRYFQNPFNSPLEKSSGVMPFDRNNETRENSSQSEDSDGAAKQPSDSMKQVDLSFLTTAAKSFMKLLNIETNAQDRPIDIQITSDGLRVTLFDRAQRPLFDGNTAEFTAWGRFVMQNLAWLIERNHFKVIIDGHTRSQLKLPDKDFTAWELSAARANAARRELTFYAVDPHAIERVSGYADTQTVPGQDPTSETNQRVTLSLSVGSKSTDPAPSSAPAAKAALATQP